ncbi:hypothetical protein DFH06DRAFT_2756 [Mycena polygramma]|nr:hypothetical protein DFH06DRAFT_2756 [Mycena polygramma]
MISLPQPPDSEVVEGCPFVRLFDSEGEVTPFLRAIFDSTFFMPHPAPTNYDTLVGVLRLSNKYGVDHLRRRALIHLSSAFPTTLAKWDAGGYEIPFDSSRPVSGIESWEAPDGWTYLMSTAQLAREIDAPWILPGVFYDLAVGYTELGRDIFHGGIYKGVSVALTAEDQQSFALGLSTQMATTNADILRFLFDPLDIEGCSTSRKCLTKRMRAMQRNRHNLFDPSGPLTIWDEDEWDFLNGLCSACLPILKKTHEDARQKFWDQLPEIYGLPDWEELERLKSAAIGPNLFC